MSMKGISKHQQGLTLWGMLFGLAFLAFVLSVVLKLGPHYMDDYGVKRALDTTDIYFEGDSISSVSDEEIKARLMKDFQTSLIPQAILDSMEVVHEDDGDVVMNLNYETRQPFMANVDVVMRFKHRVEITRRGRE